MILSEEGVSKAEGGRKLRPLVQNRRVVNAKEKLLKEIKSVLQWTQMTRKRNSIIADMEEVLGVWIKDETATTFPWAKAWSRAKP